MNSIKTYFLTLDLFSKSNDDNQLNNNERRYNIYATRIFLISLVLVLIAFGLGIGLQVHTYQKVITKPTQIQFESLNDPICPCSKTSLSYSTFISHNPTYHQVCSSDFVSNQWIEAIYFGIDSTNYLQNDFRATGSAMFQALASFCDLSKNKVVESISLFDATTVISTRALSRSDLISQAKAIISEFQRSSPNFFQTQVQLISKAILASFIFNGLNTCFVGEFSIRGDTYYPRIDTVAFIHADGSFCACIDFSSCQEPSGIFNEYGIDTSGVIPYVFKPIFNVSGIAVKFVPVDSLRQSSLECFYDVTCLERLLSYSNQPNQLFEPMLPTLNSRFNLTSTVQSMIEELMVESWGSVISFDEYYANCAPLICNYVINERNDFLYVLSTMIGLLGGFCTILAIVSQFITNLIRPKPKRTVTRRTTRKLNK